MIDGDTIWLNREKIRLANIDTPEISGAKCESELARGLEANTALNRLLDGKELRITRGYPKTRRMIDRYGRTLALVSVNGKDVGETLIERNLARRWTGRRQPWC
ncbi:thermonuclease family protein (plasmid) [Phyllobacterium sp. A18/5-2]|uniref:thermonuclease family protein n=1 Tax=Phyllobacterium sp. A18/5-2 TaxID=2978392 RepID=UPI0021C92C70|nr:thermonuclease family protein [Phyllobacterium sp. A18/5-2]UXN66076.1 thermonuclease family protein [Phyllobacterium sp. A18/5-2]